MNHKLKVGLEIGGGLVAVYVLYKLYANYQANQQAAADANSMNFLPPLSMGGYAPAATAAGTVDTGGAQLNNLLQSILSPSSSSSSTSGSDTSSSSSSSQSSSGTFITRSTVSGLPVGQPSGGLYGAQPPTVGSNGLGNLSGVGARLIIPTQHASPLVTSDGNGTPIV